MFGIINTGAMGLVAGSLSDFLFKSSTKVLMCFSFSIFLAKGIILAPVAEAGVPDQCSGAAMSVGSFATYASVFWAYALNGWIIDTFDKIEAYQMIFGIGLLVSSAGMLCAGVLLVVKRRQQNRQVNSEPVVL